METKDAATQKILVQESSIMALNLSIIKSPTNVALSSHHKTFSEQGGTIGRGDGNDWVLGDPDRFLSSRHCALSFESGQFFITDMSTNGTFLNGSAEPLGKGGKAPLSNGDTIELGDYQFRAEMEASVGAASLDPFESIEPTSTRSPGQDDTSDPFASPLAARPDPFASDPFGGSEHLSLNSDHEEVDPLAALDGKKSSDASPFAGARPQSNNDPFGGGASDPFANDADIFGAVSGDLPIESDDFLSPSATHDDGANAMNQAVDWPEARGENVIPDDWDDDFLGTGAAPNKLELESNVPLKPVNRPSAPVDDPLDLANAHRSMPLTDPPKRRPVQRDLESDEPLLSERRPEATPAFAQTPEPQPRQTPRAETPRQTSSQPPTQAPSSKAAGDALLAGLGLADRKFSEEELIELYATIGELVPVIITGMMQVLRSRASIKNEFRMNVTTIQPIENNPLKFSADAFEAIENIFIRKSSAYMGPKQAFQEGFDGIGEHQVAIIAGIRAAFKSMMDRFNPELLERQFEKQMKGVILPGMQKAKMWSSFNDHYKGYVDNMENTFQYLFGDEFVQAYEDQLRRLTAERKKRP